MKRFAFLSLLLVDVMFAEAQTCNCKSDIAFVTNYLENHYAGFSANVNEQNRPQYDELKKALMTKAEDVHDEANCYLILKNLTSFFRDNHLSIRLPATPQIDEKKPREVAKFKNSDRFRSRARLAYDSIRTWTRLLNTSDSIEGIYENDVYQIAVVRNDADQNKWTGFITKSNTPLWEQGHIKIEIEKSDREYAVKLYLRNHDLNILSVTDRHPVLHALSIQKITPNQVKSSANNVPRPWLDYKELNDSVTYLRIGTFNGGLLSKFDSAYQRIIPYITRHRYLIVDVRDNGGGSDQCWQKLAALFDVDSISFELTELMSSSEIIKRYEEYVAMMKKNRSGYGWKTIKYFKLRIRKMKKMPPGSFRPLSDIAPWYVRPFVNDRQKPKTHHPSPEKIVLMFNRNSASAAEGLILRSMNSRKVITFGENSGGYITFGNVMSTNTPSGFTLVSSTQRTMSRFQYEKTGIPPRIYAQGNTDWIDQALKLLPDN